MSFWDDALAYGPAVAVKMDLAAGGAIARDLSGNLRNGAVAGNPSKGNSSIVPNLLEGTLSFDGVDDCIEWPDSATWDATQFIAIAFARFTNFSTTRELMGKVDMWQVWIETTGKLTFYISPAWTSLQSNALSANTDYMIVLRKTSGVGGKFSIHINGVKHTETAHTSNPANSTGKLVFGYSSVTPRRLLGKGQAFLYYPGVTMSDADILALYNSSQATPVNAPASFGTVPGGYAVKALDWDDSTTGSVTYRLEKFVAGAWAAVASGLTTSDYSLDTTSWANGVYKLRVRAETGGGDHSDWVESGSFYIGIADYLAYITATGALAHWPLDDASGTNAEEAIGSLDGTYVGSASKNAAGHVGDPASPDPAVDFATTGYLTLPFASIDIHNRSFAVGGMVYIPSLSAIRYFFVAENAASNNHRAFFYVKTDGSLVAGYFGDDLTSSFVYADAAVWSYLLMRYDSGTDKTSIWVNGVKVAEGSQGPMSVAPTAMRFFAAQDASLPMGPVAQHMSVWLDTIPTDAQIAGINVATVSPPLPTILAPDAPATFDAPATGAVFKDVTASADWSDCVTAGREADTYDIEISDDDGGTWSPLADTLATSDYTFDVTPYTAGVLYKLRARGVNVAGEGDWTESATFTIAHFAPGFNLISDGVVWEDDHRTPALASTAKDLDATAVAPDSGKWTPDGTNQDRWRLGYGYTSPYERVAFDTDRDPSEQTLPSDGDLAILQDDDFAGYGPMGLHFYAWGWIESYVFDSAYEYDAALSFADNVALAMHDVVYTDLPGTDTDDTDAGMAHLMSAYDYVGAISGFFECKSGGAPVWLFRCADGSGLAFLSESWGPEGAGVYWYNGVSGSTGFTIIGGHTYDRDGNTGVSTESIPWHHAAADTVNVIFELADDGTLTLFFASPEYTVDDPNGFTKNDYKWVASVGSHTAGKTGKFGYFFRKYGGGEADYYRVKLLNSAAVFATGDLVEGWRVVVLQRTFGAYGFENEAGIFGNYVGYKIISHEAVVNSDGEVFVYYQPRNVSYVASPDGDDTDDAPDIVTFDRIEVWLDDVTLATGQDVSFQFGDYFLWEMTDLPAYAPVSISAPASREVVSTSPYTVTWVEHAPPHNSEDVEYLGERSIDGGVNWVSLFDWQSGASYDWDHATVDFGYSAQIRVKARGVDTQLESGWRYSDTFVLFHAADSDLTATAGDNVALATDRAVFLTVPRTDAAGHWKTRWQIWESKDDTDPILDFTTTEENRFSTFVLGLTAGTRYYVRYKLVDYASVGSPAWSQFMDFWTTRMASFQTSLVRHKAKDEMAHALGDYRSTAFLIDSVGVDIPDFPARMYGLPPTADRSGALLNMLLTATEDQDTFAVSREMIRFGGSFNGSGHLKAYTAMLLMVPLKVDVAGEIMGQPSDHFVWHDTAGKLHWTVRTKQALPGGGEHGATIPFGGNGLAVGEINSIFVSGADQYFASELAVTRINGAVVGVWIPVPLAPETKVVYTTCRFGHNGTWGRVEFSNDPLTSPLEPLLPLKRTALTVFDVGHGSLNAENGEDSQANGNFGKFVAVMFAYWDVVLTASEVAELNGLKNEAAALDAYIEAMGDRKPVVYAKLNEYPAPDKPAISVAVVV